VLALPRHIASTSKQARNGNIFIDVLPVEAAAAELDSFALGRSCVQQAWKPSQWHAQGAAIAQLDPHITYSSNRTAVGETLMPCPQDQVSMFHDNL
jgi:hypothetical protein